MRYPRAIFESEDQYSVQRKEFQQGGLSVARSSLSVIATAYKTPGLRGGLYIRKAQEDTSPTALCDMRNILLVLNLLLMICG